MLQHFTDDNFEQEVLQSKEPVLVDFWASWCGPCRMLGPIVEEVAGAYEGKAVKIGKMNVDENANSPQKYNILSIPTLIFFKDGKVVEQLVGVQTKETLMSKIDALMK